MEYSQKPLRRTRTSHSNLESSRRRTMVYLSVGEVSWDRYLTDLVSSNVAVILMTEMKKMQTA